MSHTGLRMGTKLGFGLGSVGEIAIYIAFNTWNFLFYNQVLGLSGTLAGLAVTISLGLDAASDPIVGSFSDRLRSKLGRRHPFLYAAPIPLALSFFLLYSPPAGLSGLPLFVWFTVFAVLHRQAMTFYSVPHLALGAELSSDYHERSVVMAYSTLFGVLGGAAVYFFGWTWFSHVPGGATARTGYAGLGLGVGLLAAGAILLSAHFTRDQIPRLAQRLSSQPALGRPGLRALLIEIKGCLANRNYRMLLFGLVALSATTGTRETVNAYAGLFFWELPEKQMRLFGLASPPAYIVAFFATVWLHRRIDKRNTIVAALVLLSAVTMAPVTLRILGVAPPNGSPRLLLLLLLATFCFYLAVAMLMISVLSALADVADEHELETGRRQEGVFYAARTFFAKLSSGLGHVIAGVALDLIQFPSGAKPGEVAHAVALKVGILDGPVAAVPALLSIVFYGAYRIDRSRHAEIQRALRERRRATTPADLDLAAPQTLVQPGHVGS